MNRIGKRDATPATSAGWVMVAVLILFYFFNSVDRGLLSLVVRPVKAEMAISDFEMSLLLGLAFGLFYAGCGLPIGWLIDRVSRRIVLYAGVSLWSLATIATAFAASYPALAAARVALGIGEATLGPCAHSLIADRFQGRRMTTMLSIYTLGSTFGVMISFVLGGILVGHLERTPIAQVPLIGAMTSWRPPFLYIGLVSLLLAFLAFAFREPPARHAGGAARPSLRGFVRRERAVLTCFAGAFGIGAIIIYGILAWLPTYMDRRFGYGPAVAGPIIGIVNFVTVAIGSLAASHLIDRRVARGQGDAHLRIFCLAQIVGGPIGILAFLADDPIIFLIGFGLFGATTLSFIGYAAAAVQSITPTLLRGRMAAIYLMILALIGQSIGPSAVALLSDHVLGGTTHLGGAMAILIAVVFPVATLFAVLGRAPMRRACAALAADQYLA